MTANQVDNKKKFEDVKNLIKTEKLSVGEACKRAEMKMSTYYNYARGRIKYMRTIKLSKNKKESSVKKPKTIIRRKVQAIDLPQVQAPVSVSRVMLFVGSPLELQKIAKEMTA